MSILKFLRGTWWGADLSTLPILYNSHIRSLIDYASFIYFSKKKSQIECIEKIQYASIRYALGYRISTPTNYLIAESKLTYLHERSKYLCLSYLSKILTNKSLSVTKCISRCNNNRKKMKKRERLLIKCILEIMPIMI